MDDKINELQSLVKELRDKFEQKEVGLYTKAEFDEFSEKINKRIDELETKLQRPQVGDDAVDERKEMFFKYIRHGLAALEPTEKKKLVETGTVGSGGEILVPESLMDAIFATLPKYAVMRRLATIRPIGTDRARVRTLTEPTVSWAKLEAGSSALTEQTGFAPSEKVVWIEDLYGLAKIGEDELMDSDVSLQSMLADGFSRAIGFAEDLAFVNGTGHASGQPEGILNATPAVTAITTATAKAFAMDDLFQLIYAVAPEYRANSALLVHPQTELALRLMKSATDGQYLWQPAVAQGTPPTFAGYPVYNHTGLTSAYGTLSGGEKVAIFGDFRTGYMIVDRLAMTLQRLDELYAEYGLVGFKVHFRVGGAVVVPDALRILAVKTGT